MQIALALLAAASPALAGFGYYDYAPGYTTYGYAPAYGHYAYAAPALTTVHKTVAAPAYTYAAPIATVAGPVVKTVAAAVPITACTASGYCG